MHTIRKLSVTEHPRPFENTVFLKTNTWKRMWGYFKAWAFKTYSIQAFIDHAFYLRYLRYLVIGQKQNFLGANGNSHPKRFSESLIIPSFLFREAESENFPCEYTCTTLVNEPDKYGEIIAIVYEHMKRTQEMLFADWAQSYKGFVPNQEPASVWIFGNASLRVGTQGLIRPYLKTFVTPFLSTRLTAPGSPRMHGSRCTRGKGSLLQEKKKKGHVTTRGKNWVHSLDGHDQLIGYQNNTFPIAVYGWNESGFAPLQIRPRQIHPVPIELASFVTSSPPIYLALFRLYLIEFAPNISNIIWSCGHCFYSFGVS